MTGDKIHLASTGPAPTVTLFGREIGEYMESCRVGARALVQASW
jgi:hypothetical protein